MAKIVESLKRLSVENGATRRPEKSNRLAKSKGEYIASIEESVSSDDQNYILAICGTQR